MSMKWLTGNLFKQSLIVTMSLSLVFTSGCALLPKEKEEEVLPEIVKPQISKKPEYDVTTQDLVTTVPLIGKMISLEEETLFFTQDKRVKAVHVKVGTAVKAGDVIAELDVETLEQELRFDRIAFKKLEDTMKDALRNQAEMEPNDFAEKQITFETSRQKLVDKETEIKKATIVAPFDGTVVTLNVVKGDLAKAYDPIAIVADTKKITAASKLTKTELEKVAVGMEVEVNVSSVGKFKGKINQMPIKVAEEENNNGGNGFPGGNENKPDRPEDFMLLEVSELPKDLKRGTPISVSVITKRTKDAIVIPPSTLRNIGSRTYVQVIDDKGNKREVDIEIGQQTATAIEVLQGLEPGQKVVGR